MKKITLLLKYSTTPAYRMTPLYRTQFSAKYEYRMCFDFATLCHNATRVAMSTCSQFSKGVLTRNLGPNLAA